MPTLPAYTVAQRAGCAALALLVAVGVGSAPVADTGVVLAVRPPAVTHVDDSNDPDQDPPPFNNQDPPEAQGPSTPGQKTLTPQHRRSHHRVPTST
jgi:hypothetical protein